MSTSTATTSAGTSPSAEGGITASVRRSARAEGVIAFEVLLERLSNWTIADDLGGEDFERSYLLRGHRHLWIRW